MAWSRLMTGAGGVGVVVRVNRFTRAIRPPTDRLALGGRRRFGRAPAHYMVMKSRMIAATMAGSVL
jgi:hypothetical protein